MHFYSLDESVTPSRIQHSRSSTLLPYTIDVDPDRQETGLQLDHLEAKDVAEAHPHTPSTWHGFSLRRGTAARKSTSSSSRKQSRKGRISQWSAFSWILKAHRNSPSDNSAGGVSSEKSTVMDRADTIPSSAPSSTTSFSLSYRSHNSSFTSISSHPPPTDIVVLDPCNFDILTSKTHESSDAEVSIDSQGSTLRQMKPYPDTISDSSPRLYHTNISTTSLRYVPDYHLHRREQRSRRPYGKLLYVPNFDVTLEQNGNCLQKCITEIEGGRSYPHSPPSFHPISEGYNRGRFFSMSSEPASPNASLGCYTNVNPPIQQIRPLTILKRKNANQSAETVSPRAMDRNADVLMVMEALSAVGQQMDKEHDTYIRTSLTREPHEDNLDTMTLNDQWCDVVSLEEYLGS